MGRIQVKSHQDGGFHPLPLGDMRDSRNHAPILTEYLLHAIQVRRSDQDRCCQCGCTCSAGRHDVRIPGVRSQTHLGRRHTRRIIHMRLVFELKDVAQLSAIHSVDRKASHRERTYDMLIPGICSCHADGTASPGPGTDDQDSNRFPALHTRSTDVKSKQRPLTRA